MQTIFEAFDKQVSIRPNADALAFPDYTYSYLRLSQIVDAFTWKLREDYDVGVGSTVMLQSNEPLTVLAFFLACSRLGAAIVERNLELVVPEGRKLTHHFHAGPVRPSYPADSLVIDSHWSPSEVVRSRTQIEQFDTSAPFFFAFSSGTTGVPKIVSLSHLTVLGRSLATKPDFEPEKTRFATLLPVGSRPFMARALGVLANGATVVDGTDHAFWLSQNVNFVSTSVKQATMYFHHTSLPRKIAEVEIFGSRPRPSLVEKLLSCFEMVQDAIGSSETSKFFANRYSRSQDGSLTCYGQSLDSEVEVVSVVTGLPTRSEPGRLRVRNSYLAGNQSKSAHPSEVPTTEGWQYTGDLASWQDENVLLVEEREGHIFNFGGNKIHAGLVDRVLCSTKGIKQAISFKNPKVNAPDELFAFVVFEEDINRLQVTEVARLRVEELLGAPFVPRVIRGVSGLPRTPDGEPDRESCARFILELADRKAP